MSVSLFQDQQTARWEGDMSVPCSAEVLVALSAEEAAELKVHEEAIGRCQDSFFLEAAPSLEAIREKKLYKASHGTFERYCQDRWGFSASYARMKIEAARVMSNLKIATIVAIQPDRESQVRPLTKLEPDDQREAWQVALDKANGKRPTAKQVQEAVDDVIDGRARLSGRSTTEAIREGMDDIKEGMSAIDRDLAELRDREGWKALGYPSFEECVEEEFPGLSGARCVPEGLAEKLQKRMLRRIDEIDDQVRKVAAMVHQGGYGGLSVVLAALSPRDRHWLRGKSEILIGHLNEWVRAINAIPEEGPNR